MPHDPKDKSRGYLTTLVTLAPAAVAIGVHGVHLAHPPDTGCIYVNCERIVPVPLYTMPDAPERHPGGAPVGSRIVAQASSSSTVSSTAVFTFEYGSSVKG